MGNLSKCDSFPELILLPAEHALCFTRYSGVDGGLRWHKIAKSFDFLDVLKSIRRRLQAMRWLRGVPKLEHSNSVLVRPGYPIRMVMLEGTWLWIQR
jgi:hypothetical protein